VSAFQLIKFFFQENSLNNSQIRTGRFLFDELFGIDIIDSTETDEESLRNCTCGKNFFHKLNCFTLVMILLY